MLPSKFKSSETGAWVTWTSGSVDPQRLESFGLAYPPSYINGALVYALQFTDGREWDIKQGWKQL